MYDMANDVLNIDDSMVAETLPTGLIGVDNDHIQNMANFSMYVAAKNAVSGDPVKKGSNPSAEQLDAFGNWTGQTDTKVMAADLMKRGLIGAGQLLYDNPNLNSADAIRNAQSDWKIAAIQKILSRARELNFRNPETINANKKALMSTINPRYRDAINSQDFQVIHPNFWSVIAHSLIPEQYAKEDAANLLTKK